MDFFNLVVIYISFFLTNVVAKPLMLTPLIEAGQLQKARDESRVVIDKNQVGFSGYFTVPSRSPDKQSNNVFTWIQPCTDCNPATAPFILWLQGGPGAPGTFGCLSEIGNYYVADNMKLEKRCFTWCAKHNCLFVDQPTMTGFSFPVNSSGLYDPDNIIYTRSSTEATEQVYEVIQQVFTLFPQFQPAPFYITGESYGGLYCAHMGYTIMTHNQNLGKNVKIHLKAVMVGDPMINADYQFPTYPYTLHGMGLIMEDERDKLIDIFKRAVDVVNENCTAGFNLWNSVWNDNGGGGAPGLYYEMTGSSNTENSLLPGEPAGFDRFGHYFDPVDVQKAFHFYGSPVHSSEEGGLVYNTMVESGDWCSNSSWLYATLFLNGIDVMIYSSTVDPLLGPPTSEAGVRAIWDYAATQPGGVANQKAYQKAPKVIWKVDDKDEDVAGYAKCFTNSEKTHFCYTVIRNAGHESPAFQPRANYDMFLRFVQHRSFSKDGDDSSQIPKCAPCGGVEPFAGDALAACQKKP